MRPPFYARSGLGARKAARSKQPANGFGAVAGRDLSRFSRPMHLLGRASHGLLRNRSPNSSCSLQVVTACQGAAPTVGLEIDADRAARAAALARWNRRARMFRQRAHASGGRCPASAGRRARNPFAGLGRGQAAVGALRNRSAGGIVNGTGLAGRAARRNRSGVPHKGSGLVPVLRIPARPRVRLPAAGSSLQAERKRIGVAGPVRWSTPSRSNAPDRTSGSRTAGRARSRAAAWHGPRRCDRAIGPVGRRRNGGR